MRKLHCRKLRINSQGYTSDGSYFGVGPPVYFIAWYFENGTAIFCDTWHVRAYDRESALSQWKREFRHVYANMKHSIGKR